MTVATYRIPGFVLLLATLVACGAGGGQAPELATVSVATLRQDTSALPLSIYGSGFNETMVVGLDGDGVEVTGLTFESDSEFTAELRVAADAAFGPRDLLLYASADRTTVIHTLPDAVRVLAPVPLVSHVTPGTLQQGDQALRLQVVGEHFREGGVIELGEGFEITSQEHVSDVLFEFVVNLAVDTPLGPHDLLYRQPEDGGGDEAREPAALQVHAPDPVVLDASVSVLKQGDTAVLVRVEGVGFRPGGTIDIRGGDLQLGVTEVLSASEAEVLVTVPDGTPVGPRDVGFIQPVLGGGASDYATDLVEIHHPDPTISNASPATLKQEESGVTVTVTGTGFRDGGTLTMSGTGLTLGSTTIVSSTEATIDVTVAANAPTSARNVTYTQPAAGGGAAATGTSLVSIHLPDPSVTSVSPATVLQGTAPKLTVTGDGFPLQIC